MLIALTLLTCLILSYPSYCLAGDDRLLFGDEKMVDGIGEILDYNQRPGTKCDFVRRSKVLEQWRKAYLRNQTSQDTYLREVFHQLEDESNIMPLLENLNQRNMYDLDETALPERLAPTRFYTDLLNSALKILGPKNILVADLYWCCSRHACDKNDRKKRDTLNIEEYKIRRVFASKDPKRYLGVLNSVALAMSHKGQEAEAKEIIVKALRSQIETV